MIGGSERKQEKVLGLVCLVLPWYLKVYLCWYVAVTLIPTFGWQHSQTANIFLLKIRNINF